MKIETLKMLIENVFDRNHVSPDVINEVMLILELYDNEISVPVYPNIPPITNDNGMVPYSEICGCNPKNGGGGICGCVIGNRMVPNKPLKTNWGWITTSSDTPFSNINNTSNTYNASDYGIKDMDVKYSEKEVSYLLEIQRGNCFVAVLNSIKDSVVASEATTAPEPMGGDWKKSLKNIDNNEASSKN